MGLKGLVHIYCGDGKGKTTAAVGLAVRAAGAGKRVLFVQFFKGGDSSEIPVLGRLSQVETLHRKTVPGFFKNMTPEQRERTQQEQAALLEEAVARAGDVDLLVLDEAVSACNCGVVDEGRLLSFLRGRPEKLEVVLTGQDPSARLLALADYATQMRKLKHPYDSGVTARLGIEY